MAYHGGFPGSGNTHGESVNRRRLGTRNYGDNRCEARAPTMLHIYPVLTQTFEDASIPQDLTFVPST